MQDLARVSLRPRSVGPRRLLLALAIAAPGLACTQKGPLSDQEMEQLRAFTLPPGPPADPTNAYADDPAAITLGRKLYFETGYAGPLAAPYNATDTNGDPVNGALGPAGKSGMVGCASCHDPASGGGDHRSWPNQTSLGASYTVRNAPTVINAAYSPTWQFWDGRADSLWSQALQPPEGTAECAGSRLKVVHVLHDKYKEEFEKLFGAESLPARIDGLPQHGIPGNDPDRKMVNRAYANFGKAIAAYERQLVSNNFDPSPFDRFMAGDEEAMSPAAVRGARLFIGHAGCVECHRGPMFTDYAFHNIGVPQMGQYVPATDTGRFDGIRALVATKSNVVRFDRSSDFSDMKDDALLLGLGTEAPSLATGQFKTPTLRNVTKTAPYMHDGAYQTLWDVVNHYNFGGATGNYAGERDPAIAPLMLTSAELADLVEFLEALEDGPLSSAADPMLLSAP